MEEKVLKKLFSFLKKINQLMKKLGYNEKGISYSSTKSSKYILTIKRKKNVEDNEFPLIIKGIIPAHRSTIGSGIYTFTPAEAIVREGFVAFMEGRDNLVMTFDGTEFFGITKSIKAIKDITITDRYLGFSDEAGEHQVPFEPFPRDFVSNVINVNKLEILSSWMKVDAEEFLADNDEEALMYFHVNEDETLNYTSHRKDLILSDSAITVAVHKKLFPKIEAKDEAYVAFFQPDEGIKNENIYILALRVNNRHYTFTHSIYFINKN